MKNRIRELREARGMSQADLARLIGTSAVSVGRYEKHAERITLPLLEEIANALRCDALDIITDGETASGVVKVPIMGTKSNLALDTSIVAGIGRDSDLFAFRVADDAMSPTLSIGDLCVVDAAIQDVDLDGIFAIKSKDRTIIRRIALNPVNQQLRVSSDNQLYGAPIEARPRDIKVEGRVVWVGKRL